MLVVEVAELVVTGAGGAGGAVTTGGGLLVEEQALVSPERTTVIKATQADLRIENMKLGCRSGDGSVKHQCC